MKDIRKISVGDGHPDRMMHYQVGKEYNLSGNKYVLTDILMDMELMSIGKVAFNIYVANDDGKVLWKTIVDVPVIIENNIDFE